MASRLRPRPAEVMVSRLLSAAQAIGNALAMLQERISNVSAVRVGLVVLCIMWRSCSMADVSFAVPANVPGPILSMGCAGLLWLPALF